MNFPNDETGSVLQEMHEAGIDLTVSHSVEFFQLFESETQARALAQYIEQSDIKAIVKVHPDKTPNVWDVDCTLEMIPSYDAVVEQERAFEKMAAKFDGYNDGWGILIP